MPPMQPLSPDQIGAELQAVIFTGEKMIDSRPGDGLVTAREQVLLKV